MGWPAARTTAGLRECTPACTMCDAHCAAPGPLLHHPDSSFSSVLVQKIGPPMSKTAVALVCSCLWVAPCMGAGTPRGGRAGGGAPALCVLLRWVPLSLRCSYPFVAPTPSLLLSPRAPARPLLQSCGCSCPIGAATHGSLVPRARSCPARAAHTCYGTPNDARPVLGGGGRAHPEASRTIIQS